MDRSRCSNMFSCSHLFLASMATAFVVTPVYAAEGAIPPWADEVVSLVIKVFGVALIALAGLAMRKLAKKWGIESSAELEALGRKNAQAALNFADRWARLQDEKPSKESKLERGLDRLIEIEKLTGIGEQASNALARRIETELEVETKRET